LPREKLAVGLHKRITFLTRLLHNMMVTKVCMRLIKACMMVTTQCRDLFKIGAQY